MLVSRQQNKINIWIIRPQIKYIDKNLKYRNGFWIRTASVPCWLFNCRKGQLQPQFRLFKTVGDWTLDTQIQKFLPRFFCTRLQLLAYYDVEIPDMISVSELWRLVSWQSVIGPLHTGYLVTRYLQDNNVPWSWNRDSISFWTVLTVLDVEL